MKWKRERERVRRIQTYSHSLAFRMCHIQRCFLRICCHTNHWLWPDILVFSFAFQHRNLLNTTTIHSSIPIHLTQWNRQISWIHFYCQIWWTLSPLRLLTSAWMRITCSCHFTGTIAVAFLFFAWSRSELLTTATISAACTPCTPITPTGIVVSVAGALTWSVWVTYARFFFR